MKMKRPLLTALATAVLAAAATLTIFAASPKDEATIRYLEQQPLPLDSRWSRTASAMSRPAEGCRCTTTATPSPG